MPGTKKAGGKTPEKKSGGRGRARTAAEKGAALAVLDAAGGNVKAAARATGLPEQSVRDMRDDPSPEVAAEREASRKPLADRLEDVAYALAGLIPGKAVDASLRDVAGALKITVEMRQLLTGKPTAITATDDAKRAEYEGLVERVMARAEAAGEPAARDEVIAELAREIPDIVGVLVN